MTIAAQKKAEIKIRAEVARCLDRIRKESQFLRSLRLLIGVSGGEDSCVLLHALVRLRTEKDLELGVCHINHGLRSQSSRDAGFVEQLVSTYQNIPFFLQNARPENIFGNVEAWGRTLRYEFYEKTRIENMFDFVLTAHHQSDEAETVLFRVLSGRALTSGYTIQPYDAERRILRPLLRIRKEELVLYRTRNSLQFVVDETNEDRTRTRNRIRHELLPLLAQSYNPNVLEDLALFGSRLNDDEEYLWSVAEDLSKDMTQPVSYAKLALVPRALRWRLLASLSWRAFGEDAKRIGFHAYLVLFELLEKSELDGPKMIELGFGYSVSISPKKDIEFIKIS